MELIRIRFVLLVAFAALGLGNGAQADTITLGTTLSTSGQSMWSAGEAIDLSFTMPLISGVGWGDRANPLTFSVGDSVSLTTPAVSVLNPKWLKWHAQNALHNNSCVTLFGKTVCAVKKPAGSPPAKYINIPSVNLGKFGLEFSGSTHGTFGLDLEADFQSGQITVDLPVEVQFEFDRAEIIPGQTFTLKSIGRVLPDAKIETLSPTAEARLMLDTDMKFESDGTIYLGPEEGKSVTLIPDFDVNDRHEIVAVGTDGLRLFDIPVDELADTVIDKLAGTIVDEVLGDGEASNLAIAKALASRIKLHSAENDVQNTDKELREIEAAKKENEKDIARKDKELNDSLLSFAAANEEKTKNQKRIDEIDAKDTNGLSDDEKNKLAAEKSGLTARNKRLDSRKKKLATRTEDLHKEIDDDKAKGKKLKDDKSKKETELSDKRSKRDTRKSDYDKEKDKVVKAVKKGKKKAILGSLLKLIETDFTVPVVETQGGVELAAGGTIATLNSTGEAQFLEFKFDVDQALTIIAKAAITGATAGAGAAAVKFIPPLSGEYSIGDFFHAEYATVDLGLGVRAYASQSFEFAPEIEVVLDIGTGTPLVFDLGDSVEIRVPDTPGEFVLKPYLRVKGGASNFTNSTGIRIEPFAELAVLGVTASVGLGSVGSYGISAGPLVGSIETNENGVSDLIPNDYPLDTLPVIEIGALSGSWELGGFSMRSLGAITFESGELTQIPGGGFDSLDGWNSYGSVTLENGAAKLTTASPVMVSTLLNTPFAPFSLLYDYRFEGAMGGMLTVFLDSRIIDSFMAVSSPDFQTRSIYLNDPAFDNMTDLLLEFEYFDETGAVLYLDNVRTSGVALLASIEEPAPIPEPSTWALFSVVAGAALLLQRRRRQRAT